MFLRLQRDQLCVQGGNLRALFNRCSAVWFDDVGHAARPGGFVLEVLVLFDGQLAFLFQLANALFGLHKLFWLQLALRRWCSTAATHQQPAQPKACGHPDDGDQDGES